MNALHVQYKVTNIDSHDSDQTNYEYIDANN